MASEKCFRPSEQTNRCAQTTNYYQNTTTDACYDKHKPTYHEHSLVDKVKELAHSASKIFNHNEYHGHAAHRGHCAHGHGHGHGHSAHSHEHGHSAHGHEHGHSAHGHAHGHSAHGHAHGHSAHSHGHGHSAQGHEHGHSAHSHEHGHSAHSHGHTPTANYSTGAAHGGLAGYTANKGGQSFPYGSISGSSSECECNNEPPKKTC